MYVEPKEEFKQIFNEGWRNQRDYLYVSNMHGADWPKMKEMYGQLLPYVNHRADLNYLLDNMGAEIAIGHSYVRGGDMPDVPNSPGGLLGADFTIESGRYKLTRIYDNESWNPELRAPLAAPGVDISVGDYILAINGAELKAPDNIYRLLDGTANRQTVLTINNRPALEGARQVTVIPTTNEQGLRTRAWVEANRRLVDKLSDGKLFYDWRRHGEVADASRALAVSCNLSFANLALRLGFHPLHEALAGFGLGRLASAAAAPALFGGIPGDAVSDRDLAGLGSGTAPVETSLVHAAAIALALGRGGEFVEPRAMERKWAIGGHAYGPAAPGRWRAIAPAAAAEIVRGMREAVEDFDGTAAKAAVATVAVAAKTGSYGEGRVALDGLIVGFAPAEGPKIAFAVLVRGEGMASGTAALMAHDIVVAFVGGGTEQ